MESTFQLGFPSLHARLCALYWERGGKVLLTYAAIGGSSSGVGGVRGVELEARGGHGLWVGHGDVTGEEARLEENRGTVV